ncbi:MAG TPA: hypothetical protein DIT25_03985 [Candidatus Moranbacteria bacterium]|nr:hypothetical protein [Candidatus Moranbacteria bacterium]
MNPKKMLKIPKKYSSLEFIKLITWSEIFEVWKKGEAHQESWKKHREERGFASWDEWREAYARPLNLETLEWSLYRIKNPTEEALNFYGTPTRGWVEKAYNGQTTKQLKDIVGLPIISENDKIKAIKKNFPKEAMLTGLVHDGKIILIEGMHRSCALASWGQKQELNSKITIALAAWDKDIQILGGNYKNKNN